MRNDRIQRLLLLLYLLTAGCGGSSEEFLIATDATLDSVSVTPQVVNVGSGFSIPFNEPFSFQAARETDPKTAQIELVGHLSNGVSIELPIEERAVSFSPFDDRVAISPSGLLSAGSLEVCGDSIEIAATYRSRDTVYSDTFIVNTACFVATAGSGESRAEPFVPQGGIYDGSFVAQFRGPDSVDRILAGTDLTYSLKEDIAGVSVARESGDIRVNKAVPVGRRLIVSVSYQDPQTGLTFRSEVEFEVESGG